MPSRYQPEMRRQVFQLAGAGSKPKDLAEVFGMSQATIYNWLRQQRIDSGEEEGTSTDQAIELKAARKRIKHLETELAVSRKVNEVFLSEGVPPKRLFPVIEALIGQGIDARHACRVLGVSRGGYYAWKDRPLSKTWLRRIWLTKEIIEIHRQSRGTSGDSGAQIRRGVPVGQNTVARSWLS